MSRNLSWLSLALSAAACAIALHAMIWQERGINRQLRQREAQLVQRYSALLDNLPCESDTTLTLTEARSFGDIIEAVRAIIARDCSRLRQLEKRLGRLEELSIELVDLAPADIGRDHDLIQGTSDGEARSSDDDDAPLAAAAQHELAMYSSPSPSDQLPTLYVYSAVTVGGEGHLFLGETDGGPPAQLTFEGTMNHGPAMNPADGRIAFISNRDGHRDIYVLDVISGDVRRLTEDQDVEFNLAWSPDGAKLAWDSTGFTIRILDIETGELAEIPDALGHPSFSRDGARLTFIGRGGAIIIANPDGSESSALTKSASEDPDSTRVLLNPLWSPDGQLLAVSGWATPLGELNAGLSDVPSFDVMLLQISSRTLTPLTVTQSFEMAHDWSSDGRFLLVSSDRTGTYQLYALATDGSRMSQLTHDNASKQGGACWWLPGGR